ncbi:MAG TPA: hypothetical protein VH042_05765 [Solirubrobacterales bacterium]|nr:hypothetical protein [Solirubrobacterales bacterium]
MAIPAVAAIALGGAVAFGGCGSDSNAATNESTTDSMHHEAMKHEGEAMKHEGDAMKHKGDAMKHENGSMKDQDKAMKHEGSSSDHMEG